MSTQLRTYRVGLMPGDGTGPEVIREGRMRAPLDPIFPTLLSEAALAKDQRMEAHQWLLEALQRDPEDADAYFRLGRLAELMGNTAAARNYFETGLRFDPYNKKALELLSTLPTTQQSSGSRFAP